MLKLYKSKQQNKMIKDITLAFDQNIKNKDFYITICLEVELIYNKEQGQTLESPFIPEHIECVNYEVFNVTIHEYTKGATFSGQVIEGGQTLLDILDIFENDEIDNYIEENFNKLKNEITNN